MALKNPYNYEIILASGSPRRQQFLNDLEIPFRIQKFDVEESYPQHLKGADIAQHITTLKADPFRAIIKPQQLVITADTIVWHQERYLGKPQSEKEAFEMLTSLSGATHEVITVVGFLTAQDWEVITARTEVTFNSLSNPEIEAYIATGSPMDKAGAYGIQDRIGTIGIKTINGSYTNVVGLPMAQFYTKLVNKLSQKPTQ